MRKRLVVILLPLLVPLAFTAPLKAESGDESANPGHASPPLPDIKENPVEEAPQKAEAPHFRSKGYRFFSELSLSARRMRARSTRREEGWTYTRDTLTPSLNIGFFFPLEDFPGLGYELYLGYLHGSGDFTRNGPAPARAEWSRTGVEMASSLLLYFNVHERINFFVSAGMGNFLYLEKQGLPRMGLSDKQEVEWKNKFIFGVILRGGAGVICDLTEHLSLKIAAYHNKYWRDPLYSGGTEATLGLRYNY